MNGTTKSPRWFYPLKSITSAITFGKHHLQKRIHWLDLDPQGGAVSSSNMNFLLNQTWVIFTSAKKVFAQQIQHRFPCCLGIFYFLCYDFNMYLPLRNKSQTYNIVDYLVNAFWYCIDIGQILAICIIGTYIFSKARVVFI